MYWQKRQSRSKYGNRSAAYNGHVYHSIREADYAAELDIRVKAGELERWERQVPIELRVNGQKICTYTIDFVEYDTRGNVMYTEIKGFETPEWRLKWKLFDALHPEWEKQVIKWVYGETHQETGGEHCPKAHTVVGKDVFADRSVLLGAKPAERLQPSRP